MAQQAYTVVDTRSDRVVASFNSSAAAYDDADRRDRAYGVVRFRVERDYEVMSDEEFATFMDRVRAEKIAA